MKPIICCKVCVDEQTLQYRFVHRSVAHFCSSSNYNFVCYKTKTEPTFVRQVSVSSDITETLKCQRQQSRWTVSLGL